jgi:hypothetical protein
MMRYPVDREVSGFYYNMWGDQDWDRGIMGMKRRMFWSWRACGISNREAQRRYQWLHHHSEALANETTNITSGELWIPSDCKIHRPAPTFNEVLDQIRRAHEDKCTPAFNIQTKFFCGFHEACNDICSEEALAVAKRVLVENYLVVGLLEQFGDSLHLLELEAPAWFAGIVEADAVLNARSSGGDHHKIHSNSGPHEPATPENILLLKQLCVQDIRLYEFAREVLVKKGRLHGFDWSENQHLRKVAP